MEKQFKPGREEITGVRDGSINQFLRDLEDFPFVDLDFVGLHFANFEPIALIDWKKMNIINEPLTPSIDAIFKLANRASLPFFVVYYNEGKTRFVVIQQNNHAYDVLQCPRKEFTGEEMAKFLFNLSGREVPQHVLLALSQKYPSKPIDEEGIRWLND